MYQRTKLVGGLSDMEAEATTPFSLLAAATTNQTQIKRGAGVIVSIHAVNVAAAVRYLKFYDINVAPVAGQGTPVRRYAIPASTTGAGFVLQPVIPMRFTSGIAFTLVTGVADTDTTAPTANDVILTIEYI